MANEWFSRMWTSFYWRNLIQIGPRRRCKDLNSFGIDLNFGQKVWTHGIPITSLFWTHIYHSELELDIWPLILELSGMKNSRVQSIWKESIIHMDIWDHWWNRHTQSIYVTRRDTMIKNEKQKNINLNRVIKKLLRSNSCISRSWNNHKNTYRPNTPP